MQSMCSYFAYAPEIMNRLIAVTPAKLGSMSIEEVRKICVDYTMAGLETLAALPRDAGARPFRFIYTSGAKSERDQQKKPWILAEHVLMRVRIPLPL